MFSLLKFPGLKEEQNGREVEEELLPGTRRIRTSFRWEVFFAEVFLACGKNITEEKGKRKSISEGENDNDDEEG